MHRLRQMAVSARIVEIGSITAAAEHLVLSKSVVSHHLKILESELGGFTHSDHTKASINRSR